MIPFFAMSRPKKAAKLLSSTSGKSLSACQEAVAVATGYSSWFELGQKTSKASGAPFEPAVPAAEAVKMVCKLAQTLGVPAGSALYDLQMGRVLGVNEGLGYSAAVLAGSIEATEFPKRVGAVKGQVARVKSRDMAARRGIIVEPGGATTLMTDKAIGSIVANSELSIDTDPNPLFIPRCLYLPYGYWTEEDGSRVAFSREYNPMWRLREGRTPERLAPWLWIDYRKQTYLTPVAFDLENDKEIAMSENFLVSEGITEMPMLAEMLTCMVMDNLRWPQATAAFAKARGAVPEGRYRTFA